MSDWLIQYTVCVWQHGTTKVANSQGTSTFQYCTSLNQTTHKERNEKRKRHPDYSHYNLLNAGSHISHNETNILLFICTISGKHLSNWMPGVFC